jgi:acyl carrier protein
VSVSQQVQQITIEKRVREVLAGVFGQTLDGWDAKALLRDIPEIRYDSMSALECLGAIEQEFGITIDIVEDDVTYNFQSVGTIVTLVKRKLADREALGDDFVKS